MRVNSLLGPTLTRDRGNCWHTDCLNYGAEKYEIHFHDQNNYS